ncbi:MAG: DUF58 domain-containing protein [Microthrixaceae bacterium]
MTRRGVLLLVAVPPLALLAWVFGLPEAAVLSVAALVVVVGAWTWVTVRRPLLEIRRAARPVRCTVGDLCRIQLDTRNRDRRRSPVVLLRDEVGRHGAAELHLGPLDPGARVVATYTLPTDRRGLQRVGPLRTTVEDPFGLARRTRVIGEHLTVIVLPRTWALAPLPPAPGDEPEDGITAVASLSTVDEEFSTLRAYVAGDDIRRIHWPTTARTGSPVVREFDLPWQHRTTIVMDLCPTAHDERSFERLVSVAASVVELSARGDELVRLVSTGPETATGFVSAVQHRDALLDGLAAVAPDDRLTPGSVVETVRHLAATASGRLVVCTGRLDPVELADLDRVAARFGVAVIVSTFGRRGDDGTTRARQVRWDGRDALDVAWSAQLAGATVATAGRVAP